MIALSAGKEMQKQNQQQQQRRVGTEESEKRPLAGNEQCPYLKSKRATSAIKQAIPDEEPPMLPLSTTNSNSSNETVIARCVSPPTADGNGFAGRINHKVERADSAASLSSPHSNGLEQARQQQQQVADTAARQNRRRQTSRVHQAQAARPEHEGASKQRNRTLKNIIHLAGQHLSARRATAAGTKDPQEKLEPSKNQTVLAGEEQTDEGQTQSGGSNNGLLSFAQRYLFFSLTRRSGGGGGASRSAPSTPLRAAPSVERERVANGSVAAGTQTGGSLERLNDGSGLLAPAAQTRQAADPRPAVAGGRPSVRFLETAERKSREEEDEEEEEDGGPEVASLASDEQQAELDGLELVSRLFKLPGSRGTGEAKLEAEMETEGEGENENENEKETGGSESPMDSRKFRSHGYRLIDYICNYLDTIRRRRVTPINIEPGYLKSLIEPSAPEQGQCFATIMHDFESKIMRGITHWQHPHFHAYFPAGNAYPSILADMLSDALGCVGFSWAASPAYTELEIIMLDWMGKMIGLPEEFLCLSPKGGSGEQSGASESKGGGVIQGSASECVLVSLLAARHWAMEKLRKKYPGTPDGLLLGKLIGYCSKEAHSCVEKAAMIGFIRMRALETDERQSLRGETLAKAIAADRQAGLEPFIVCATLGTTSCVSFDNLQELGEVCKRNEDLWLHVDAAYAGSALICPEFKYLIKGIELATSFNMNPNKWLLINFDCSLMWVKDRFKLTRAFVVDPLYLQHSFSDQAIDYRHWGIPLSRRFRALKLWFTIRNYGIEGLRQYIRNHCRLAKVFEGLIRGDSRFMVTNEVVLGLVCFRLVGSNALNQRLLSMINASGKLHMVPASVNGRYVIRFCVCDQNARDSDIHYAYRCISDTASELFESIRAGRERIRAISQQNTIDVSSISLHTQQSASADRLNSAADEAAAATSGAECSAQRRPITPAARTTSVGGAHPSARPQQPRSPLTKQATVQQVAAAASASAAAGAGAAASAPEATLDDPEQEIAIDSLASIDGQDYDLELDDMEEAEEDSLGRETADEELRRFFDNSALGEQQAAAKQPVDPSTDSMSPMQRALDAAADEQEAADAIAKLVGRRNRMSLRYKREFFVRVVSDPRVYRASISGDINAHRSSGSLATAPTSSAQSSANSTTGAAPPSARAPLTG